MLPHWFRASELKPQTPKKGSSMKRNNDLQPWIRPALIVLTLAAATSLSLAADITYTFNSDVQGWSANGHGTVAWDATHGRGGGGCLMYTITNDTEADPIVDVAFDTTGYFSVEFDLMVDPASGVN